MSADRKAWAAAFGVMSGLLGAVGGWILFAWAAWGSLDGPELTAPDTAELLLVAGIFLQGAKQSILRSGDGP